MLGASTVHNSTSFLEDIRKHFMPQQQQGGGGIGGSQLGGRRAFEMA